MAKRALSQSLARELGPRGVHVSHVVVDGAVDNPNTRRFFSEKNPDFLREFDKKLKVDGLIQPASVAELYLQIHNQVLVKPTKYLFCLNLKYSGSDCLDP